MGRTVTSITRSRRAKCRCQRLLLQVVCFPSLHGSSALLLSCSLLDWADRRIDLTDSQLDLHCDVSSLQWRAPPKHAFGQRDAKSTTSRIWSEFDARRGRASSCLFLP